MKAKKLTNSAIERLIKIAGQGIQDARVSPHTFRHFYAQIQLKNGMDIYTLSRLLGHEKVSITQIYLQNMQDAQIVENAVNSSVIASLKK